MKRASNKQGDIAWINLDPQAGHEQKGRRPVLIVSNTLYNKIENTLLVVPITNTYRNTPMYVALDSRTKTQGYIMANQQKSLVVRARNIQFIERIPKDILEEVLYALSQIISRDESNS